eukprot:3070665-Lingulodinium_polyedra.AAC.1
MKHHNMSTAWHDDSQAFTCMRLTFAHGSDAWFRMPYVPCEQVIILRLWNASTPREHHTEN